MTKRTYSALKMSVAPLVLGISMLSMPAMAQDADADVAAEDEFDDDIIVVTGTLIRDPNVELSSPVLVTGEEEIDYRIATNAEELVRDIPGLAPGIGSAVNNGNNGTATVNLRALGDFRNVVLLDGQRIVPNDLEGIFDLNNVPLALIEQVEVLTGGASTTYGADAVTGVVNFITKDDFAGFELRISNQITEMGDGNRFRVDATIGANFDDGRGNVVLSIGYQNRQPVYQGDRAFSVFNLSTQTSNPGGSTTTVPAGFSFACAGMSPCPQNDVNFSGNHQFDPATGGTNSGSDYQRFNFNPFNIFQNPFRRYNIYAAGKYEIADAIEVYSRALYSRNTVSTIIAPSGSFGANQTFNLNNPLIPEALARHFCNNNDFDPDESGIQSLTEAQCTAGIAAENADDPNYQTFTANLRRRAVEIGPRLGDYQTNLFDYMIGFRGDITQDIQWDVKAAYGQSTRILTQDNYLLNSRLAHVLLSDDGVTCSGDDVRAGCAPANVFDASAPSISVAAADYLRGRSTTERRASLLTVQAVVNGDLGFNIPWASEGVQFAAGGEYRKYTAFQQADALAQQPGELGGAGGAAVPIRGNYNVWEGFGELAIPVVQDVTGIEDFTIEFGARYSSYTVEASDDGGYNTFTWKAGGSWSPGMGLKFRGGFNRAVRAPNISELFTPLNTVLDNLLEEPCAGAGPSSNANLAAICRAQGAPDFTIGNIPQPVSGQVNVTTGGNINLKPEVASTWTIGMVWQAGDVIPGFDMSIDYYNIKVVDAITTPTSDDAIDACFGNITAASASSLACTQIGRNPSDGGLSGDPAVTSGLFLGLSNLGTIETDGIDFSMNYSRDLNFATLRLNFVGNWTNSLKFQATPSSENRECVGFYSSNCTPFGGAIQPKFSFTQRTSMSFSSFDVSFLWRFVGAVEYEPILLQAQPDSVFEDYQSIDAYHNFDLSVKWTALENLEVSFLVTNLFNRQPPIVGADAGTTAQNSGNTFPSTYDALGRSYAVSAKVKF